MTKNAVAGMALAAALGLSSPVGHALTATYEIEITNTLDRDRVDAPVSIVLGQKGSGFHATDPRGIAIDPGMDVTCAVLTDGDREIPVQLDDLDGDGTADELTFTTDIPAGATLRLRLTLDDEQPPRQYTPRVYATLMLQGRKKGESVPVNEVEVPGSVNFYNMCYGHGPMFESELVGYRIYFNEKQTLDPYGKYFPRLELGESRFYPDDDMLARGFGDDVLLAGNSCGIGAFKGWNGTEAVHIAPVESRRMRVVASGPVRTVTDCDVRGWDSPDGRLDMKTRYTLYAGHRDVQVDALFPRPLEGQTFATGVEKVMGGETTAWSDHNGLVACQGRHWPVNDTVKYAKETIRIATCVPRGLIAAEAEDASNLLYTLQAPGSDRITYHTMFVSGKEGAKSPRHTRVDEAAADDRFGRFNREPFFEHLPLWRQLLENPVQVKATPISGKR